MSSSNRPTDHLRKYSVSPTFDVTVLISGSGSNLQALIDASRPDGEPRGKLSGTARVTHVISNRKDAYGLVRAEKAGIPTSYHNLLAYKKKRRLEQQQQQQERQGGQRREEERELDDNTLREQYDRDLAQIILTHIPCPDLVVCAGWMHILSAGFISALTSAGVPIINLHPALPGQFSGANAIARAWEAFQQQQSQSADHNGNGNGNGKEAGKITETGVMVHHVISEVDAGEPIVVKRLPLIAGESLADLESRIHQLEWKAIVEATEIVLLQLKEQRSKAG